MVGDLSTWKRAAMPLVTEMGLTVSLFITALAFGRPEVMVPAKMVVLVASVCAGFLGYLVLRLTCRA